MREISEQTARQMLLIRAFENQLEKSFEQGSMRGTTHGSIGQEAVPAILMPLLQMKTDYVFATHRCHGYYLAYSGDAYSLAAEMMGRSDGPVAGAGGSQHLRYRNFYTNGITGGMVPEAVGVALGLKRKSANAIAVAVLGDGGFNEGYVQESLNLAAVYQVPVLFLLENNSYAMSTPSARYTAGSIAERVQSYHMPYYHANTSDLYGLDTILRKAVIKTRQEQSPVFLEVETFRLCGHSKSDDCAYMTQQERQEYKEKDPIQQLKERTSFDIPAMTRQAECEIQAAFARAEQSPELTLSQFIARREGADVGAT